jgi:hypothetical protein
MRKMRLSTKILRAPLPAKFFLGLTASLLLTFGSCKKDSNLGLNVQPQGDLLNSKVTDTTTVVTWIRKEDSLYTSGALSAYVLGSYWDPVFGKVTASVYTQFVLPGAGVNFDFAPGQDETKLSCDSLVMTLAYGVNSYGDTTTPQTVTVYQMTSLLSTLGNYKSDTSISVYQVPLGSKTFYPTPKTLSTLNGKAVGTHIRIPLDKGLGQLILNQSGQAGLANNTNFLKLINGFYIHPETPLNSPGKGAMVYLNIPDTLTALTVYYKNGNLTSHPDTNFSFEVNSNAARFSKYEHYGYTNAQPDIQNALSTVSQPTHPSQPVVYCSSLAGLKTKIQFPYLNNWTKTNTASSAVSINKAELTIKVIPSGSSSFPTYAPPDKMALVNIDSLGHEVIVVDNLEGTDYFGGVYDAVNNQYVFHLDRYVQQIVSGKQPNRGLYLITSSSAVTANRVVLGGGNNTAGYKMKLRLNYIKLH